MTDWEVLRFVHPIGSPLPGTVIGRDELTVDHGVPVGHIQLSTSSKFSALLPYSHLMDDLGCFSEALVPEIGQELQAVVFNFVRGTLYLSAKPSDLHEQRIAEWEAFYQYLSGAEIDQAVVGRVTKSVSFGLFVDLGKPYIGLIDIGFPPQAEGLPLPRDRSRWPKEGDEIRCLLGYVRLHNRQLGLYWYPK